MKRKAVKIGLKDLPLPERPRERLKKFGPNALNNSELLAIIIGTGTKGENVINLANRLLKEFDLRTLSETNVGELMKILGIGEAKACQIVASFELSKRLGGYNEKSVYLKNSEEVARLFMGRLRGLKKECFRVVLLTSRNRLIKYETVSQGSLEQSIANPREIFKAAIQNSASKIILVHNHPSGDPAPSEADLKLTEKLMEAGELLNITVLDHIIIGDNKWWSWREEK